MKNYQEAITTIINRIQPATILDAPAGNGWLIHAIRYNVEQIDGIDLYASPPDGYHNFSAHNLDQPLPSSLPKYEAIVCCEGIEHITNPGVLIQSITNHLQHEGTAIISTPNIWYPSARLAFFFRGFFPSFPSLVGKINKGSHMHLIPWSWPQLYLFFRLHGFTDIQLHKVNEPKPKHLLERLFGFPLYYYCTSRATKADNEEERQFWLTAATDQSIYGRRLVVSATKNSPKDS